MDVIEMRKQTHFGPDWLHLFLLKDHHLSIPRSTLYAILKRNGLIRKAKKRKKTPILYSMPSPACIQMDIKFNGGYGLKKFVQYSAQDDATRIKFTRLYRDRSNSNSLDFLAYVCKQFPFQIKSIRTDNDSVFTDRFAGDLKTHPLKLPQEYPFTLACRDRGIHHKLNDPACPELNGKIERSHRTESEEFYRLYRTFDLQLLVKEQKNYDEFFNNSRSHMGLKGLTPLQKLNSFREFKSVSYVYSESAASMQKDEIRLVSIVK